MDNSAYYIWWISGDDCDLIYDLPRSWLEAMPQYLQDQFWYRNGRAGRGRLWVADNIPIPEIKWDDASPVAAYAEKAGGIVFHAKDLKSVKQMATGRITNLDMQPI